MIPDKKIFICLLMLPFSVWAQDSLFRKKVAYADFIYLNNPYKESRNPVSMLYNPFDRALVQLDYKSDWGDFRAKDDPQRESLYTLHLGGIKHFKKMVFEGFFRYANMRQDEKSWNSTLLINKNNPFVLCDSFPSDFTVEKFHLNGGIAYKVTPRLQAAFKADYQVASSSNQTDPRPKIDGMRFLMKTGVDYNWGNYTLGVSGFVGWMSETCDYTTVNTHENYPVFLMHGLAAPDSRQAIGYHREYSGVEGGVGLQFLFRRNQVVNFTELGFSKNSEKAEDGGEIQRYKGGNYRSVDFIFKERYAITCLGTVHSFIVENIYGKVEGVSFLQNQKVDQNGNISWLVVDRSVCHKQDYNDFGLSYRVDKLTADKTPHVTLKIKGGIYSNQIKHYPELYEQQASFFYGKLDATKHFYFQKSVLSLRADVNYWHPLHSKNKVEGSFFDRQYTIPDFEYHSAGRVGANFRADINYPLRAKSIEAGIGVFIKYGISSAIGSSDFYQGAHRSRIETGVSLIY